MSDRIDRFDNPIHTGVEVELTGKVVGFVGGTGDIVIEVRTGQRFQVNSLLWRLAST